MTTEHFEEQLLAKQSAVHVLSDTVAEFLLNRGHAAKIGEIASQAGKRMGAGAKLIRQVLTTSPQFVGEERRWNLKLRTLFHRPIEGALQETLRLYGRPLTDQAIANEMAVLNARAPEFFQGFLPQFMADRPETYFRTPDGRWGLVEWLLDTEVEEEDELLMRNFFLTLDAVRPALESVTAMELPQGNAGDIALALLKVADMPLATRVMSYAVWKAQGSAFDPQAFYLALLEDPRVHLLSGGEWIPTEQVTDLLADLQALSAGADVALEEEEAWEGPYAATPDDLAELYDFLVEHGRPQKLSDLVEAVLEYGKASPRYQSVYEGLTAALEGDSRYQLVGRQTWALPALIPQEVLQVPEALLPEAVDSSGLPDPETDAELEDEGLEGKLALWVHDPRYEDFGGEHEVELSLELMSGEGIVDETRVPLLYDHREMGTLKLRQADTAFFPTDTPLACVTVHDAKDLLITFQIWINNEELLIHGLADWYDRHDIPVGAVLTFRRGDELDDYILSWEGEIDELIALSEDRIADLLEMRDPAEIDNWSVYDTMRHTMAGRPEGAHFLTIWAEVNVIRRTPKRVVASNLSSYHCFVPITNTEKWRLDERKVEQGRKKTKKKFILQ